MLKGFQLLFRSASGREPRVGYGRACYFPVDDPFNQGITYTTTHGVRPPRYAAGATRGLRLREHNFHNDMRRSGKRSRIARTAASSLHLTYKTDPRQMTDDPKALCLRNQYSSGIMSIAADRLPHRVNHVRGIDVASRTVLSAATKSRAMCSLKEETEGRRARCNELCRPVKLLPSSGHPSYYGSSFVEENHFGGIPDAVGFTGGQI